VPQVVAAYTVSGAADVLVHLRAADMADFEQALETLRSDPAVARTESTIVLSTLLDRTDTPRLDSPA
jgi:DNA-binding Lrp family transcriptional regulator